MARRASGWTRGVGLNYWAPTERESLLIHLLMRCYSSMAARRIIHVVCAGGGAQIALAASMTSSMPWTVAGATVSARRRI
jgi:hypothetical protein